jgi:hypothetical protein
MGTVAISRPWTVLFKLAQAVALGHLESPGRTRHLLDVAAALAAKAASAMPALEDTFI